MSKRNDISDSNHTHTTSASHQGYIERPSATEEITPEISGLLLSAPAAELDDGLVASGFAYPQRVVDGHRASFGTLGRTKAERKEFWNEIERNEGTNGRVQNRIIAELPVEFSLTERCMAARDFCHSLEERGLPYWAAIHAPGKRNDKRNYHLHITYFDRPTGRDEQGRWAHAVVETKQKKSRNIVKTRPYRSNKHPDTRARNWPKRLRRNYSDTCNFHLSIGNYEKRYDPRPYRESGIEKEPTEHLGNKLSALESMGLETNSGERNAKKEIRWKFAVAAQPWIDRAMKLTASSVYGEPLLKERQLELETLAEEGITHARKSASLSIVSDLINTRMESRRVFLDEEIIRLGRKDDLSDLAQRSATIIALTSERDLLEERAPALQKTAKKCTKLGADEMRKSRKKMKTFDHAITLFDPESLLDDETLESLDDLDDLPLDEDYLDDGDMNNIDDLFGDAALQKDEVTKESHTEPKSASTLEQATDARTGVDEETQKSDEKTANTNPEKTQEPITRIEQIIQQLTASDAHVVPTDADKIDADAFPGAWSIQPTRERDELTKLDRKLATLDNRQLRQAAIASRDATDLCPAGKSRDDFGRGWSVLRYEAERRGLDLDTGIHAPESATDAERALIHTDQDPCPIRVIRKNIARQRVRA